jgi:hypothetical protein
MVQKPNIVRGIPMLLVRAMPTIYYYGRYAGQKISEQAKFHFESHVEYMIQAIKKMAFALSDKELESTTNKVASLFEIQPAQIENQVYEISRNLSAIFSAKKDVVKQQYDAENGVKHKLIELFRLTTKSPRVAVVDTSNEFEWVDKLANTLADSCYYDIVKTRPLAESYTDDLLQSDFVLFASATPQRIHEDVEHIKTYKKPSLILGQLKKDEKLDQQTMRNGSWLRSRGYDVLFKLFSPLRMFTSIDKINIRFLLEQ